MSSAAGFSTPQKKVVRRSATTTTLNDGSDYDDDSWEKPSSSSSASSSAVKSKTQKSTPSAKIHLGGGSGGPKSPVGAKQLLEHQQQHKSEKMTLGNASSSSWSDEDKTETDFDDWKPGKSKPSPRNFGVNPHASSRRAGGPTGFGSSETTRKGFFKNKRVRQCVVVVVLFALLSTYFSGSASRKERKRMENVTVTASSSSSSLASPSSGSSPRRAGSGSAHASIGFDAASKKRAEGKRSGYDVADSEELLMEQRERYEHPPSEGEEEEQEQEQKKEEEEEEENLAATAEEEKEKQSHHHPFAKNAYGDTNEEIVAAVNKQTLPEKEKANDENGEENEEKEETVDVQEKEETLAKSPEIDGEFVPKTDEEEEEGKQSSEHLESLKNNDEEMSAHPDIGKLVGAIPKDEEEGEEKVDLSAPPKPESNAPPKIMTEPALTKVPTKNVGKPKDKVLYPPTHDAGRKEEEGEEAVVVDEEKKEEKTEEKEDLREDETKKMTLDVSDASTSEGFDFSAGLDTVKATEENEDKRISDTELAAIEKEEDAKEKELESEDEMQKERKEKYDVAVALNSEDNTQISSKKEETPSSEEEEKLVFHDVETRTIEAEVTKEENKVVEEAEPIPAKKMKQPIVSDGEIDAFVKSGMLPAANEDRKEVKIAVPVEPEKDDVLDLKRAGMSDELGFDFADGLTPATVETTTTTTEEEEEEEQKEVQEPEQEKTADGEKQDEN